MPRVKQLGNRGNELLFILILAVKEITFLI